MLQNLKTAGLPSEGSSISCDTLSICNCGGGVGHQWLVRFRIGAGGVFRLLLLNKHSAGLNTGGWGNCPEEVALNHSH